MKPAIGDKVTTYLGRPATIVDTDGNGRYKTASGLWWTWDGKAKALQEAEAPTEAPGSAGEGYTACVARLLPDLAALPNWVAYKMAPSRKRPGKTDKKPVNPHTGKLAKADDSATWAAFDQAAAFLARRPHLDGLGFQLGESPDAKSGIVGVDLDNCIDAGGNLAPWAAEIVARLDSYTEVSPSGKGIRIFCRGKLPAGGRKKGDIEMYDYGRFLTVTGNAHGAPRPIRESTAELAAVHAAVFGEPAASRNGSRPAAPVAPTNLDDVELLEKACNASNGDRFDRLWRGSTDGHGGDHSAADQALCNHLAFWTGNDAARIDQLFRQSGLMRPKWDERHSSDGRTYGQMTIDKAIQSTAEVYSARTAGPAFGANGASSSTATATGLQGAPATAAEENGPGPRFAVGQLVNVVIGGLLQNAAPCLVMEVHPQAAGEYGYTVAWPGEEQAVTYQESNLEPADEGPAAGANGARSATPQASAEKHLMHYTPDDGGMLDDWLEHDGGEWLFAAGFEQWHRWKGTHWEPYTDYAVKAQIQKRLDRRNQQARATRKAAPDEDARKLWQGYIAATKRSKARIASVEAMARNELFIDADQLDSAALLNLENGTLDLGAWPFRPLPHDRKHLLTYCLPYAYDPAATAPNWTFALSRLAPEIAAFLQEFAGYALTPETSLELALWLVGGPGGGKSTYVHGLQTMLGPKAGLLGLADIERSRFALADLPGKTLVVSTEQPGAYMASTHILNAIISGEPITVDMKFRDPVVITPRAKIAWAMNDFPRVSDANNGIFRRVKVVNFPAIPEAERRPELKEAISHEGAGILNWALEGLRRLRDRGRFDVPAAVIAATKSFIEQNDIPANFVEECCYTGQDANGDDYTTQSGDLYSAYRQWALDTGHKPQSATSIAREWERLGFERYRANGRTFWRGVGLRNTLIP